MKITIEATELVARVNGVECRVWRGITERGVACDLFVSALRVRSDADCSQFAEELRELPQPQQREAAIDLRFLIA